MTTEIVILAMIAAFLGLRLYSVLGRRAEQEEEPIPGRFDNPQGAAGAARPTTPAETKERPQAYQGTLQPGLPPVPPLAERGLREIAAADRRFDAFAFLDGARGAYRMVLEAFWQGDRNALRELCDLDVYNSFLSAIDARQAAGETLQNSLVRIEEATIVGASYDAPTARITVRFRSDIAAVTRDASGAVIAGSLHDAVEAVDVWSFSRNIRESGPDWLLDETDEG